MISFSDGHLPDREHPGHLVQLLRGHADHPGAAGHPGQHEEAREPGAQDLAGQQGKGPPGEADDAQNSGGGQSASAISLAGRNSRDDSPQATLVLA